MLQGLDAPALLIHEAIQKSFASLPDSDSFHKFLNGESSGRKQLPWSGGRAKCREARCIGQAGGCGRGQQQNRLRLCEAALAKSGVKPLSAVASLR